MARMQRNRESAMLSRQRKKMQLDELERQNKQLQATNTHLSGSTLYPSHLLSCTSLGLCVYRRCPSSPLHLTSPQDACSLIWHLACYSTSGSHTCGCPDNKEVLSMAFACPGLVAGLASENAALRHQLAMAGQPVPQPAQQPFTPPPAVPCPPGMSRVLPMHAPQPYAPWQFPGVPFMAATSKVPHSALSAHGLHAAALARPYADNHAHMLLLRLFTRFDL